MSLRRIAICNFSLVIISIVCPFVGPAKEKVEGEELQQWLKLVVAPKELSIFVRGEQESLLLQQAGL